VLLSRGFFAEELATPRMKVLSAENKVTIAPDHPDEVVGQVLLAEALGTGDIDFLNGLVEPVRIRTMARLMTARLISCFPS
jgi:hypothetical protein